MTTWWVYYPEEGYVQAKSRDDARCDLYGDDFLYDDVWSDGMNQVCIRRCDQPLPHFDLGRYGNQTGDRDDWIEENSVITDRVKEKLVAERPEPPLALLAPWRMHQLDDWWMDNWGYPDDCDRILDYQWIAVRPDEAAKAA